MAKDVVTPTGFLRGKVEVKKAPEEVKKIPAHVVARGNTSGDVEVEPGQFYALPLAPGQYRVNAVFGAAKAPETDIFIEKGKTVELNFVFE